MNVLIVEDESHTALLLQEIIEQDHEFTVLEKLESVIDTIHYLNENQNNIHLCFFDIQLADGKSFEIFKHIDVEVPIVFCTAYDEYILQAIKNNGIDYILKPFKEEEIHQALNKYKKLVTEFQTKHLPITHFRLDQNKSYQKKFLTRFRKKTIIKSAEEVALFFVENEMVYLYTFSEEKLPLHKKMEYLESVSDPKDFFRINRQMLINRNAIISFEPFSNRKIILQIKIDLPEKIVVSRLKVSAFKEWLEY